MKLPLRSSLLSLGAPTTLKTVGLWVIILGLIGEAAVIVFVPSGGVEKSLSVACTLLIALGVWLEKVGGEAAEEIEKAASELTLATINTRAAEARERTAEIERATSWRRISPEQHKQLADDLKEIAPSLDVFIEWQNGDTEAFMFANSICAALMNAGLTNQVNCGAIVQLNNPVFGIFVGAAPPIGGLVIKAFENVGFLVAEMPPIPLSLPKKHPPPNLVLHIGSKLPVFPAMSLHDAKIAAQNEIIARDLGI